MKINRNGCNQYWWNFLRIQVLTFTNYTMRKLLQNMGYPRRTNKSSTVIHFKKGTTMDCNNYRNISVLLYPSKILGIVKEKINYKIKQ